jgi:ornithine cyclodeaminase/alanine dehydrogenase-like protein (mu-crystallin family)
VRGVFEGIGPHVRARLGGGGVRARGGEGADVIALVTRIARARAPAIVGRRRHAHLAPSAHAGPTSGRWRRRWCATRALWTRAGALAEAGALVIPIKEGAFDASHIAGELGDVFGGRIPGRQSASDITIFKSLGMAVEDVAAARLAFDRAAERGLGRGFVL